MTQRGITLTAIWSGIVSGAVSGGLALLGIGIGYLIGSDRIGAALAVAIAGFLVIGFGGTNSKAMIIVGLSWWVVSLVMGRLALPPIPEGLLIAVVYLILGLVPGQTWGEVARSGGGPVLALLLITVLLTIWFPYVLIGMREEAVISVVMVSAARTAVRFVQIQGSLGLEVEQD